MTGTSDKARTYDPDEIITKLGFRAPGLNFGFGTDQKDQLVDVCIYLRLMEMLTDICDDKKDVLKHALPVISKKEFLALGACFGSPTEGALEMRANGVLLDRCAEVGLVEIHEKGLPTVTHKKISSLLSGGDSFVPVRKLILDDWPALEEAKKLVRELEGSNAP